MNWGWPVNEKKWVKRDPAILWRPLTIRWKKKTNKAVDNEATKYESEDTGLITDRIQQD